MILLSSFENTSTLQFEGHCWAGADLVVGQRGAEKYKSLTGKSLRPGLDGCYIFADHENGKWIIGTDSRGLVPLFVYQESGQWAVSSSLFQLVSHVRKHSAPLTPTLGILAAFGAQRAFTDQLASLNTQFEEVVLAPSFASVTIQDNRVQIDYNSELEESSYEEALEDYLATWRGRFLTLSSNESASIHVDLSGGIDSRTVLAFALADENFDIRDSRFSIGSGVNQRRDYEVATKIVGHYGLALQSRRQDPKSWSQSRALETWREDSFGVYLPLYFHGGLLDPFSIHAHGAGGGNFRPHYVGDSISAPVDRCKAKMDAAHFEEWRAAANESSAQLTAHQPHVHPLILHYREFRNRFHFGHRPRHSVMFTPLESGLTDQLTDRADGRDERQLYFDVMENLAPGLKDFEFDDPSKAATGRIREDLTLVDIRPARPGMIYGEIESSPGEPGRENAYRIWIEEASRALGKTEVNGFMGRDIFESASAAIDHFHKTGKRLPSHRRDLMNLSFARNIEFTLDV